MMPDEIEDLIKAVRNLHDCRADYIKSVDINEVFEGQTVWQGTVHVFDVDHPDTDTCYVWSSPIEGSDKRKFYAVLHIPPVDSPEKAVRASIIQDYKASENS